MKLSKKSAPIPSSADTTKQVIVGDGLDHNNMVKSLKSSSSSTPNHHSTKSHKIILTQKIVPFHDNEIIVKEKKTLTNAIYYEELEKEERLLKEQKKFDQSINKIYFSILENCLNHC